MTLEFGGAVVGGTIEGGYSCGGLYADTFFYGFESKAPLIPIPEGTELRIEGGADLKNLTLEPIGRSRGKEIKTERDAATLVSRPGGYTMGASVTWDHSSLTFDLPVRLVDTASPVPLASVRLPESGSSATLSFEGRQIVAVAAMAQRSRGEIRVAPTAAIEDPLRLPPSAEIWVNADPGSASAAWAVAEASGGTKVQRVDFGYYDAMGLDLSALEPGSYQLLIGTSDGEVPVGYAFGVEVLDEG